MTTSQKTINLVVHVEGGLVQAVYTDSPLNIRVAIQDFDIEGADLDELATLPNGIEFLGHIEQAITDNQHVDEVFAAFDLLIDRKTDAQQENYLKTHGKFCPNCGSMNIEPHGVNGSGWRSCMVVRDLQGLFIYLARQLSSRIIF